MISRTTDKFWKLYARLDDVVKEQARASYHLFEVNPQHPSLQFKKVHAKLPIYSARINLNHRAVGIREGEDIIWFWIGPHNEYEKVLARL